MPQYWGVGDVRGHPEIHDIRDMLAVFDLIQANGEKHETDRLQRWRSGFPTTTSLP